MNRILSVGFFFCFLFPLHAQITLKYWTVEDHSGEMRIEVTVDTMNITAPKGVTLWYNRRLTGDYEITYSAKMVMQGGKYDRLSDLNCFWGANDPKYPNALYARSVWRKGIFSHYNTLNLFYVGYGGNNNSTTRFRQYFGSKYGMNNSEVKPLIKEYKEPNHLLIPNQWYHTCIRVEGEMTTYYINGEELFRHAIKAGECDGHFGLRLLENHVLFTNFQIRELSGK